MIREEKYYFALADGNEKILDFVYFEVRGSEQIKAFYPKMRKEFLPID
jgi:hypothetical protein